MRVGIRAAIAFAGLSSFGALAAPASAQTPKGDIATWITTADYPAEAISAKMQGALRVTFTITPQGGIADCRALYSSAPPALVRWSCILLSERAEYDPARTAAGAAIASTGELTIEWNLAPAPNVVVRIPFGGAQPLTDLMGWLTPGDYGLVTGERGDATVEMLIEIGTDGRISACKGLEAGVETETGRQSCALLATRASFRQPVDASGAPIATRGRMVMIWRHP
ncbi:energy transducer TonB [Sphingomonas canadensis]|uniref:Energy transducer TonB n=1 Tax=Sphingomonas canadensis TaxID=1219257 RepID=A0ABW3H9T6_9SPHN|nr:energy transducer TonB [Sphingomonas canadensis]MCW3837952.1 energy transducer TonB [Sphingomonas canadensis]